MLKVKTKIQKNARKFQKYYCMGVSRDQPIKMAPLCCSRDITSRPKKVGVTAVTIVEQRSSFVRILDFNSRYAQNCRQSVS